MPGGWDTRIRLIPKSHCGRLPVDLNRDRRPGMRWASQETHWNRRSPGVQRKHQISSSHCRPVGGTRLRCLSGSVQDPLAPRLSPGSFRVGVA